MKTAFLQNKCAISPAQCRAARALIGWSREDLARASHVGFRTIVDFERGARQPHGRTLIDLRRAFEDAGVLFIEEDQKGDGGVGVRLKKGAEGASSA
jgi:transcriptional regulator with XRE-family HTH domain